MNVPRIDPDPADPAGASSKPVTDGARVEPDDGGAASGPPVKRGDSEQLRSILLFLPRFIALLGRLLIDPEISGMDKLLLAGAIAYVMSPLDILPDVIPVIGQLDDIYLVALCLLRLLNRSGEAKIREHWEGPEDIVALLHNVSEVATRYLPEPVRSTVRRWVEARA